ncbi:MAG: nitrilase-related carbon-nitrogen hydrolase, partial [Raineya sp.]|nr:nitrilase-related carbon-nitrogen hydrolase [Raineya sp.]
EFMNQNTCKWLQGQAEKTQAVVVGSAIIKENNQFYNRLLWVEPSGAIDFYDKRHLFSFAGEDKVFTAGNKKIIKNWKGWNILPLICYDLRFPVWSRNVNLAYDVLIYIANWPNPRLRAWDILLQARAIENQAYCVGVNRAGTDGNNLPYNGNSAVYDFKGETLAKVENGEEKIIQIVLDKNALQEYRNKFTAYLDADAFQILDTRHKTLDTRH